jgi:hypothetical protein
MLPTKAGFEAASLNYPAILPNLALVDFVSAKDFRYRYIGSDRVQRRAADHTNQNTEEAFAPRAREFVDSWTKAGFDRPHITLWRDQTHLPSGRIAESQNLSVVLVGKKGLPNCIAVVTDVDQTYKAELSKGGFQIGSIGMDVTPIDIGLGVPDLPLSLK